MTSYRCGAGLTRLPSLSTLGRPRSATDHADVAVAPRSATANVSVTHGQPPHGRPSAVEQVLGPGSLRNSASSSLPDRHDLVEAGAGVDRQPDLLEPVSLSIQYGGAVSRQANSS